MKVLVTGGAGFIGSAVVRQLLGDPRHEVLNVDKLTYAGNLESLPAATSNPRYQFAQADIGDRQRVRGLVAEFQPDVIMNLAAETHVDRSIDGPDTFIQTNIVGTYHLLEEARLYFASLPAERRARFRFHHVSTDEVYGSLGPTGAFTETTAYQPNSPYSASKAAADHLVRAWGHTYGLPVLTTNCSNNYGPYQYPEKLIPLMILNALEGKALPVYGQGANVRDWLYVEDHAAALLVVLERGRVGEMYNIGGSCEQRNIDVVHMICDLVDELSPAPHGGSRRGLVKFVADRPGHDLRYAVDCGKIRRELAWTPRESFATGLRKTVAWYLANAEGWCRRLKSGQDERARRGLKPGGKTA